MRKIEIQEFKTAVVQVGTHLCIPIPFNPNDVWGTKERHYVAGYINDYTIRGLIDSNGSGYFLLLGPAWHRDNKIAVGDNVEVVLSPEGPQSDTLAPDIRAALATEPQAKAFFDSLATFYRKNYIRWIESAKRPETRQTRIAEMLKLLKEEKRER